MQKYKKKFYHEKVTKEDKEKEKIFTTGPLQMVPGFPHIGCRWRGWKRI